MDAFEKLPKIQRPDAAPPKNIVIQCEECGGPKYADAGDFERHPELLAAPPSDTAQPVDSDRDSTLCPTCGQHWNADILYAHPEDALKQTPETFNESGGVKEYLQRPVLPGFYPDDRSTDPEDAPGGPWEVRGGPSSWLVGKTGTNRRIVGLLESEAIAVRDALNRLKGDEK